MLMECHWAATHSLGMCSHSALVLWCFSGNSLFGRLVIGTHLVTTLSRTWCGIAAGDISGAVIRGNFADNEGRW